MAEPTAFDQMNPPLKVTNPAFVKANPDVNKMPYQEFPRHLHRADGAYVVVTTAIEQAQKLGDGWFLSPDDAKKAAEQAATTAAAPADTPKAKGKKAAEQAA